MGVTQAGCLGSSGEPGHRHPSLGSHVAPGKFNAPVANPSISCLFCPLEKERGPFVLPRKKGTGADSIVTTANGQGGGVWPGVLTDKRRLSRDTGDDASAEHGHQEAERPCIPLPRDPLEQELGGDSPSGLRKKEGTESSARLRSCCEEHG